MMDRRRGSRREREGGFALLFVFLLAAVVAISLYMEMPRLAFEAQRQKEQLLMERGEQYQIAIRRYQQRGMRQGMNQTSGPPWPGKLEDLENTNGRRFLRKRYIDPMTGKDEWRIIHVANGVLTDSINSKPKQNGQEASTAGIGIGTFAGMGDVPTGTQGGAALAAGRRRPSDNGGAGGGAGDPNNPNGNLSGNPGMPPASGGNPNTPGTVPSPQPGMPNPIYGAGGPVMPFPGQAGAQPIQPGQPYPGMPGQQPNQSASSSGFGQSSGFGSPSAPTTVNGQPVYPGQTPGVPGPPANSMYPGGVPGYPTNPGANGFPPGFPQPGAPASGGTTPQQILQGILTQPRPGGMPTVTTTGGVGGIGGGVVMGGGMAGVASNLDADSVMECADHTNYKEWEFIFDPSQWKPPAKPNAHVGVPIGNSPGSSSSSNSGPAGIGGAGIGNSMGSGPIGGSAGNTPFGGGPGASNPIGGGNIATGGGPGGAGSNPNMQGQGQNLGQGMGQSAQGSFGKVCGMVARPGHQ